MMIKLGIFTCLTCSIFLATLAHSQEPVAVEKKIYRWIDKNGKVHISDQLPPEANDQARQEYSADTGALRGSVQTKLSAAEQEQARQKLEQQAYYLDQAEMLKRIEHGLLSNYETEQDLKKSFDDRTDLIKQTMLSLKASIQSRRAIVINSLNELSSQELNGQALPTEKITLLQKNHALLQKQSAKLLQLMGAFNEMQDEFAKTLEKYRQSKSGNMITVKDGTNLSTNELKKNPNN